MDPKLPSLPSRIVPQQVTPSLLPTVVAQVQPVQPAQAQPAVLPTLLVAAAKPAIVRPAVANSQGRPSRHLTEAASIQAPVAHVLQSVVPDLTVAVVSVPQKETGVEVPVPPLNSVASAPAITVPADTSIKASPSVIPVTIPSPDRAASPPAHSEVALVPTLVPEPKVSAPDVIASTPTVTVADPQPQTVAASAPIAPKPPAAEVPTASATPTPVPSAAPAVALPTAIEPTAPVAPPIVPATVAKPLPRTIPDVISRPAPAPPASVAKTSDSPVLPRVNAFVPPASAPVVREAVTDPKATPARTVKADATPASPSPDTGASSPPAPAQLPLVTTPEITPAVVTASSKDVGVKAVSDASGLKQHVSDPIQSQASSQATSQPGDQNQGAGQGSSAQQGQSTTPTPAPANFVNHTVTATVDNAPTAPAAVVSTAATLAAPADHTAKAPAAPTAPATPVPTTSALPQPAPVINTARLIQNAGQSEMRVGIRSNDFGNISISTSATRDVVSAQISLDHSELAKTLATHVPEMQARLGGNQAMEVRIDMNSQATGQGGATSPGTSTASGDGSRGDHQPRGNAGPAHQNEKVSVTATAAIPPAEAALSSRLDIRA